MADERRRLRIVSDGTAYNTHVMTSDGESLDECLVQGITWQIGIDRDGKWYSEAVVRFREVELDLDAENVRMQKVARR